jgi:RecB family exonuclease
VLAPTRAGLTPIDAPALTALPAGLPRALRALAAEAARHRLTRKVLVCRRAATGRELLRALSVHGVPWIGFEVATPLRLAHEHAAAVIAARGLRMVDEFDELAFIDDAMDRVLGGARGRLAELAEGPGLRRAMAASVRALRMAGVAGADVAAARLRDREKRDQVAGILRTYEERLAAESCVDAAGVLALALGERGAAPAAGARVLLLPDMPVRGLYGRFLQRLVEDGAAVLPAEPVFGIARPSSWLPAETSAAAAAVLAAGASPLSWLHDVDGWSAAARQPVAGGAAPDEGGSPDAADARAAPLQGGLADGDVVLDVFAASSVSAELREVLRRALAAGLRWDEVEIIATDAAVYGVALDGLCRRLGIPVGHAAGLPLARTRVGRAVAKYLEWVQLGYPADALRQMLERGDIRAPAGGPMGGLSGVALARRLRRLRVGKGLDRYAALLAGPHDDDGEIAVLAGLLRPLLDAAPRRGGGVAAGGAVAAGVAAADVAAADIARGLLALLPLVPAPDAVERTARARVAERLQRLAGTAVRPTSLAAAIAAVQARLDDAVPAPESAGGSPWTAAGGHLHLSDLDGGGWTGRAATFVVGLDSARFPGTGGSDALLVDDDRQRLGAGASPAPLPTSAERVDERRAAFAALVARLRGRVTFSYAAWDAVEGRALAPAAELLQVHRLITGDAAADYEALHEAVAPPASAVPRGSTLLDGADAWLHALAQDDGGAHAAVSLHRGVGLVRAAYPHLDAGVRALKAQRRRGAPTAWHGVIAPRPWLDPRGDPAHVVSATRLEMLGTCPHRYLLRYVLDVRVPEDAEAAPDVWLQPMERGALMHALFEAALRVAAERDVSIDDVAFEALVARQLDDLVDATRHRLPPPGDAVFDVELAALHEDARAFVAMVREDGRRFIALERSFGRDDVEPVPIVLPDGGVIHLGGAIDRVDELDDGRLLIVDYKTGSSASFARDRGVLDGGRRLQHVLYAAAAERLFGRDVAGAEYHFPTRRSENHRVRFEAPLLRDGLGTVAELLDLARDGWFIPTNEPADCRYCDYAAVCRASTDDWGGVTSPLAEWLRDAEHESADALRRVRRR